MKTGAVGTPSLPPPRSAAANATPAVARGTAPLSLHIERLVLEGLPCSRRDRGQLQCALAAELGRLFAENGRVGLPASPTSLAQLRVEPLRLAPGADPQAIGRALARSLYGGLRW